MRILYLQTTPRQQSIPNKARLRLHLLSCGYIKRYLTNRNVNPSDMAQIVVQFLFENWYFDYCYDYKNKGKKMHNIENNGKTLKCNCRNIYNCWCFYSTFSCNMKPQSGKHKIKFKINKIYNHNYGNIIGIISNNFKINENIMKKDNNFKWEDLCDYIGWSASDYDNNQRLPNGLYCGPDKVMKNNIFHKNNFIYVSNNENYKKRLPLYKNGDTVVLEYDSDLSILYFSKENDNGELDACIKNLPKNETFCWFVGQCCGNMCLTVVD